MNMCPKQLNGFEKQILFFENESRIVGKNIDFSENTILFQRRLNYFARGQDYVIFETNVHQKGIFFTPLINHWFKHLLDSLTGESTILVVLCQQFSDTAFWKGEIVKSWLHIFRLKFRSEFTNSYLNWQYHAWIQTMFSCKFCTVIVDPVDTK